MSSWAIFFLNYFSYRYAKLGEAPSADVQTALDVRIFNAAPLFEPQVRRVLQCVAVCCRVLQGAVVCCRVL